MNLLTINIVQSCNISCDYCIVKDYLKPPVFTGADGLPVNWNTITNKQLLKWLKAYIDPKTWFIEITGGEPALYKGIDTLLPILSKLGYYGIVRTNGLIPLPATTNFYRVGCWHKGQPIPCQCDFIRIIRNPEDCWQDKVKLCQSLGISCSTVHLKKTTSGLEEIKAKVEEFDFHPPLITGYLVMYSQGQFKPCPAPMPMTGKIRDMTPPVKMITDGKVCGGYLGCWAVRTFEDDYLRCIGKMPLTLEEPARKFTDEFLESCITAPEHEECAA